MTRNGLIDETDHGEFTAYDIAQDNVLEELGRKYGLDKHGYPRAPAHIVQAIQIAGCVVRALWSR